MYEIRKRTTGLQGEIGVKETMKKKGYNRSVYQSLALVFQFGINMLVPICLMLYLGIVLDRHFETQWITIVFFFVGAAAGFTNIIKMAGGVLKSSASEKEKESQDRELTNEEMSREIESSLQKEQAKFEKDYK